MKQRKINKLNHHAIRRNDRQIIKRSFNANCAIRRLRGFAEYSKKVAPMEYTEDMISAEEAAKFLDIEISTLYFKFQDAHERDPIMKKGKKIYFSRKELAQWVAEGRQYTRLETARPAESKLPHLRKKLAFIQS